jgi:hypothetical protein
MTLTVFPRFPQTQPLLTKVNMALLTIDNSTSSSLSCILHMNILGRLVASRAEYWVDDDVETKSNQ